ncbi:hypothetical protein [Diaphorobacter nitroreducens]
MNAVVEVETASMVPARSANPTAEVVAHAKTVQQVMQAVMKPNVHYGAIPGAGDKPTLLKSGAEVLCMTFRIADRYEVSDLSANGVVRYRVNCIGEHQITGATLGSGLGECSTDEEKYRWRKAVCQEEFDATPETHRRLKFGRKQGGHYTVQQIRTEPADLANTVLKMACKRAKIAMVLNVTAASDMFSQDLEDLDAELVRHLAEDERAAQIQALRDEWCQKAKAAKDRDELGAIMREGVKVFQASRDKDGYAAFAKAVQDRGAQLKEGSNV